LRTRAFVFSPRHWAILAAGAMASSGVAFFATKRAPPQAPRSSAVEALGEAPPAEPMADWCAPAYEPIAGGCLAVASTPGPQPLIVYLHGRYAHDAATEEVDRQRRLGATATAHGFAVLALRGRMGECTAAELAKWYCWPSNEHNEDGASEFVRSWAGALEEAQRRAHSKTRFVLGFSNGAYFAGLLASRALLDADAFVIAHGGPVEPVRAQRGTPPLLLLSADEDIAQDDMIHLDEELTREGWPHDSYARAGAHGLTDQDIDAALAFFGRAHETLPLEPPLPVLHRPVHHAHEVEKTVAERPAEETPPSPQDEPRP
jgi:predicted esterase